jgi:cell division protein FtsX
MNIFKIKRCENMSNKLIYGIIIIILFVGIFTILTTTVKAKGLNILCIIKPDIVVILKNEAEIEKSKIAISKIPQVKIINITYRDKEWSRMVNKMDLPNMENPFKNEFAIKIKKNSNKDEIINKIKNMSFVEDVKYDFNIK